LLLPDNAELRLELTALSEEIETTLDADERLDVATTLELPATLDVPVALELGLLLPDDAEFRLELTTALKEEAEDVLDAEAAVTAPNRVPRSSAAESEEL